MAGHSHAKNVKHRKAAVDAKRGKMWSRCARVIIVAAKTGGGDPNSNLSLRYAIDDARFYNMPKDTIDKAIKKGTGELESENIEAVMYEGYGPGGVAIICEILTDNRNRTAGEVRRIFDRHGGQMGVTGCVSYMFTPKGQLLVTKESADEETMMNIALEAGAEDVIDAGDLWQILTTVGDFIPVRQALEKASIPIESAELTQIPSNTIALEGEKAEMVQKLIEALDDNDDIQKVHTNLE